MIDVEHIVFDTVYNAVSTAHPTATITSVPVEEFASFPTVTLMEIDNRTYSKSLDEANHEHHATITYEANVYTDNQVGRKTEAKAILDTVDMTMQSMGFVRTLTTALPTVDRTLYRLYARYRVIVAEGETIGDDTVYQTYRS